MHRVVDAIHLQSQTHTLGSSPKHPITLLIQLGRVDARGRQLDCLTDLSVLLDVVQLIDVEARADKAAQQLASGLLGPRAEGSIVELLESRLQLIQVILGDRAERGDELVDDIRRSEHAGHYTRPRKGKVTHGFAT